MAGEGAAGAGLRARGGQREAANLQPAADDLDLATSSDESNIGQQLHDAAAARISCTSSSFLSRRASEAPRTLSSLPRSGKTPHLSRPTTSSPATASALAESPSVTMSVHSPARGPPASSASSKSSPTSSSASSGSSLARRIARFSSDYCFSLVASARIGGVVSDIRAIRHVLGLLLFLVLLFVFSMFFLLVVLLLVSSFLVLLPFVLFLSFLVLFFSLLFL